MALRDRMSAAVRAFAVGGGNEGVLAQMTGRSAVTGPRRGTREFLRLYSTSPWLRAVAHRIGSTVGDAMTTGRLYVAPGAKAKQVGRRLQRMSGPLRRLEIREMAKRDDLREITDHPLLDTLHRPNPAIRSGGSLFKLTQIWIDLSGEGEWVIDRNLAGMPISFWPTPPHWVQQLPQPDRPSYYYSMPGWSGQVPASEVVRFFDPDPENPYGRGSAMARALDDEIEIDEFTAKFMKGFFYNGARPDILMWGKAIQDLTPAQEKSFRLGWRSNLQGFWNAFKMHLVKVADLNVKEFTQPTLEQLQLSQLRDAQRDVVIHVFGFPKECFGITDTSNRATIDAADYLMKLYSVTPRVGYLGEVVQEQLVPLYDERLIFEVDSPVREDAEYQLKVAQAAPWSRTIDEWRTSQGLAPLPNGRGEDMVFVPFQLTPQTFDELGAVKAPSAAASWSPIKPTPTVDLAEWERIAQLYGVKPAIAPVSVGVIDGEGAGKGIQIVPPGARRYHGAIRRVTIPATVRGYSVQDLIALIQRIADNAAPQIRSLVKAALQAARDGVSLSQILDAVRTGNVGAILNALGTDPMQQDLMQAEPEMRKAMLRAGAVSGEVLAAQTGQEFSFDAEAAAVATWLADRARETFGGMATGTADVLRESAEWIATAAGLSVPVAVGAQVLRETMGLNQPQGQALRNIAGAAVEAGMAETEIGTMLEANAAMMRQARAADVAATEAMMSANQGRYQSWMQAMQEGVLSPDAERTWVNAGDEKVCPICAEMEGQTVPIMERYYSARLDRYVEPGGAHPKDRCGELVIL